ncbi:hypothetical protein [Treponema parvum]|uniref:hypothetical protein n=1 Tax=Treponema parvum TaxID=138851 RepID=UPI001AEC2C9B|nr:hypothetical protein [Treponema parvum]QTQ16272.1 hypothetical protein HXT04_05985 [Treponema parvum]
MTFDKSRVYTALNADELKIGSKCFFANCLSDLMDAVKNDESERTGRFTQSLDCDYVCRFRDDYGGNFALAYLIELPKYEAFESIENAMEAISKYTKEAVDTAVLETRRNIIKELTAMLNNSQTTVETLIKTRIEKEFNTNIKALIQQAIKAELKSYFTQGE